MKLLCFEADRQAYAQWVIYLIFLNWHKTPFKRDFLFFRFMLFTDYVQFLHDLWIIILVLEKAKFIKFLSLLIMQKIQVSCNNCWTCLQVQRVGLRTRDVVRKKNCCVHISPHLKNWNSSLWTLRPVFMIQI